MHKHEFAYLCDYKAQYWVCSTILRNHHMLLGLSRNGLLVKFSFALFLSGWLGQWHRFSKIITAWSKENQCTLASLLRINYLMLLFKNIQSHIFLLQLFSYLSTLSHHLRALIVFWMSMKEKLLMSQRIQTQQMNLTWRSARKKKENNNDERHSFINILENSPYMKSSLPSQVLLFASEHEHVTSKHDLTGCYH